MSREHLQRGKGLAGVDLGRTMLHDDDNRGSWAASTAFTWVGMIGERSPCLLHDVHGASGAARVHTSEWLLNAEAVLPYWATLVVLIRGSSVLV